MRFTLEIVMPGYEKEEYKLLHHWKHIWRRTRIYCILLCARPQKFCGRSDRHNPFLPRIYSPVGKTDKQGTHGKCYVSSPHSVGRGDGI